MKLLYQTNPVLRFYSPKTLDFPFHLHNALELVVVMQGHASAMCSGQRYTLSAGDILLVFPNQIHGYERTIDFKGYVLILPVNPFLTVYRSLMEGKLPEDPILRAETWSHTNLLQLFEMAYNEFHTSSENIMLGYFTVIAGKILELVQLKSTVPEITDALQAALDYINHNYTEPIHRYDIAKALGYNESYISHIFSDVLKTTVRDYITAIRINDAKQLLSDTNQSISQIALSLGFGSIRSFNRAFLRNAHTSPSAYRLYTQQKKQ